MAERSTQDTESLPNHGMTEEFAEMLFGTGNSKAEIITYGANCHCGAVRLRFPFQKLEEIPVMRDNCSICNKNGYLLIYPKREDIEWTRGKNHLKSYRFGSKTKDHLFCPTCGSSIAIDFHFVDNAPPGEILGINTRMIWDFDESKLKEFRKGNGKEAIDPAYKLDP
ncbi:hypothetical protein MMC25_001036 [Agyrium rufum]|nr:hypothetical protein [Agyrium rufum]